MSFSKQSSLEDLRLMISPLTNTIYIGYPKGDNTMEIKKDLTYPILLTCQQFLEQVDMPLDEAIAYVQEMRKKEGLMI